MSTPSNKTGLWDGLGIAAVILALAVAIAGYEWMAKQSGPLVVVKHEVSK